MTTLSAKVPDQVPDRRGGFTLAEVLITATIGAFVLTGILAAFVFIGRSGAMMANYVRLEQGARRGLERFGEDTRMAKAIETQGLLYPNLAWPNQVTLTIPHLSDTGANTVTWWWDNTPGSPTYQCLMRRELAYAGTSTASPTTTTDTVISNVASFQFDRWTAGSTSATQASGDPTTDQLQIHLTIKLQTSEEGTQTTAVAAATNLVVSARYILRNKL